MGIIVGIKYFIMVISFDKSIILFGNIMELESLLILSVLDKKSHSMKMIF